MTSAHSQSHQLSELDSILDKLHHFLPAQGPLRDFIHHNTLHAFQELPFHNGIQKCSQIFGTKVYLTFEEYHRMYREGRITDTSLEKAIKKLGNPAFDKAQLFEAVDNVVFSKRIGALRAQWKEKYCIDIDHRVQPLLFRYLANYLDQGISHWSAPTQKTGFLETMRDLDNNPFSSVFFSSNGRARSLLKNASIKIEDLLKIVVGSSSYYENYLFDQQFSHPGWSGIVCYIENQPESLLNPKKISLHDLIFFELLLEIDYLDMTLGHHWKPIGEFASAPVDLFAATTDNKDNVLRTLWQEALEDSFYSATLDAISCNVEKLKVREKKTPLFQSMFCIDDRESSLRTYIEGIEPDSETFGTPGFFGVEFFFKPDQSKHITKLCPAPVTPKYIIRESGSRHRFQKDVHFHSLSHSFFGGWLISQTIGFWSALQLFFNIFRPKLTTAVATSLRHTDTVSELTIENEHIHNHENHLQIGYTIDEMTDRVYNLLMSIGLIRDFAPLIYLVGHGSSSVNNPHYAAYDCGACSGRPGSVNARVFSHMANNEQVREKLKLRGITIPRETVFLGAIHDTTRDDIEFYDETRFSIENHPVHIKAKDIFAKALDKNAKERIRRFENMAPSMNAKAAHEAVQTRSVSLFEPRPELNHATNALCIVGGRYLTKNVFLDRRAFLNSYDPTIDAEGEILTRILNAAVPVCGGINLEYYFSRVDNLKMGAGTKLPHNVVGLIAVANGADGDLRPGLPSQMIEVHDPLRLLILVEHSPEIALKAVQRNPATFEWVKNGWVNYACIDPKDFSIYQYEDGLMKVRTDKAQAPTITNIETYVASSRENLNIGLLEVSVYE